VTIAKRTTTLTYSGDLTGQYTDTPTVKATLLDERNQPVVGKTITFAIGGQTATATTDATGLAKTTIQLDQQQGMPNVTATFNSAGDPDYLGYNGAATATDSKI